MNLKVGSITAKLVLGYDRIDKKLIINEKEAKVIRFIFHTQNKTKNYRETAEICNKKGFRSKRGNLFNASTIKTIVQNQIYCGFNNFHVNPRRGIKTVKKGTHEKIISKKLYDIINQKN